MIVLVTADELGGAAFGVLVGAAFVAAGAWILLHGLPTLRTGLELWWTDPEPAREAARRDGHVELVGTAEPAGETLQSPFTDTTSLACEYAVEEREAEDDGQRWATIVDGDERVPFRVVDDSGAVLVEPGEATLALERDDEIAVGRGSTAGEPIASALEELRVAPGEAEERSLGPVSVSTGDRRRYVEHRLEPGDDVHVYGPVGTGAATAESQSGATTAGSDAAAAAEAGPSVVDGGSDSGGRDGDGDDVGGGTDRSGDGGSAGGVDVGAAVPDVLATVGADPEGGPFVVSTKGEAGTARSYLVTGLVTTLFGFPFLLLGLAAIWGPISGLLPG